MPLRDYQCTDCKHEWEELRKGQTDPELCPKCQKPAVQRKVAAGAFAFATGGFSSSSQKAGQIK